MKRLSLRLGLASAFLVLAACADSPTNTQPTAAATIAPRIIDATGTVIGQRSGARMYLAPLAFDALTTSGAVVLPASLATQMGEGNNVYPHAYAPMRYQQLFLAAELGGSEAFGEVCLRPDDQYSSPRLQQEITLELGVTERGLTSMQAVFDDNYSAPPTTVFSGTFVMPATGTGSIGDWKACIQFTKAFVYTGGNLIVEMVNRSAGGPTGTWVADLCSTYHAAHQQECNTTRAWAYSATADTALYVDPFTGLAMRLSPASPGLQTSSLKSVVAELQAVGSIRDGQALALSLTLDRIAARIQQADFTSAARQVDVFLRQLSGLTAGGQLTAEDARKLVDAGTILKRALNAD